MSEKITHRQNDHAHTSSSGTRIGIEGKICSSSSAAGTSSDHRWKSGPTRNEISSATQPAIANTEKIVVLLRRKTTECDGQYTGGGRNDREKVNNIIWISARKQHEVIFKKRKE